MIISSNMMSLNCAVYSTSPKVAVARAIDWFAAVYGFCLLDVWNGTDAFGVMVDPGH